MQPSALALLVRHDAQDQIVDRDRHRAAALEPLAIACRADRLVAPRLCILPPLPRPLEGRFPFRCAPCIRRRSLRRLRLSAPRLPLGVLDGLIPHTHTRIPNPSFQRFALDEGGARPDRLQREVPLVGQCVAQLCQSGTKLSWGDRAL
eukprot:2771551-Prymnesium_polylepis.2